MGGGVRFWVLLVVQLGGLMNILHGGYASCSEEERLALLRLRPSFPGLHWDRYDLTADCCSWDKYTIMCNSTGRVIELHLGFTTAQPLSSLNNASIAHDHPSYYYLNASLFLPFQHLTSLDLSYNFIAGCLKNEGFERLSNLRNLKTLDLSGNHFSNTVLASLRHLSSLKYLDLAFNSFNGSLHLHGFERLSNLRNLKALGLRGNYFNNTVLASLRHLSSLKYLDLAFNFLNGSLHLHEFAGLNNLEELHLGSNPIKDVMASNDIGALPSLKLLSMPNCSMPGLHQQLFDGVCGLTNLRSLDMSQSELNGNLPACFSNLTALEYLDISGNQLSGDLRFSPLGTLHSIQDLLISGNKFQVPSSLAPFLNLSKLRYFDASDNEIYADMEFHQSRPSFQLEYLDLSGCRLGLRGAFPKFLYHQHELKGVYLYNMNFSGQQFPTWLLENNPKLEEVHLSNASLFGSLTLPTRPHKSLIYLLISDNVLVGNIPREFGTFFPNLDWISMSNNQLIGSIPSSIGDMKNLSVLDLSNNNLSGEIPASLARGCFRLDALILSNNSLQGEIFNGPFNLTNLSLLVLDGNNFSGRIPNALSKCSSLYKLDLGDNNLSGGIPPWIANMTWLREIIMSNNGLEGPIPEKLFNMTSLQVLDLSGNLISGRIPSDFNLPYITDIYLSRNKLKGSLPSALCKSTFLTILDLSKNLFTDAIPRCVDELQALTYLILKGNSFQGDLPLEICQLTKLSVIDLSYNNLSGSIPSCLNVTITTAAEVEQLRVDSNRSRAEPKHIEFRTKSMSYSYKGRQLSFLSGIDLSCNKLTGSIPQEIGRLNRIYVLNLSHNSLTGGIPLTISDMRRVESLDLSYNNLQGGIAPQIVDLNFLEFFNVSFNNLSGPTPKRVYQFGTFEASSYVGNPFLCGEPLPKSCNSVGPPPLNPASATDEGEGDGFMDMTVFYISLIASYITSLLTALLVLWINPNWRRQWFYYAEVIATGCYYYVVDHLPKCFDH